MSRINSSMVNVVTFSEAGGHAVNEDAFVVERHPGDPECWVCCLGDGQGGRAGGSQASQVACRTAIDAALRESPGRLASPLVWAELLHGADKAVCEAPEAGFTTLVGFCITKGYLAGASCGDSAVLVATNGQRPRVVTAGQSKNPPVGSGEAPFWPFGLALVVPWAVVAMSDGVWKYAGWDRVEEAVAAGHGQQIVERLQEAARLRGGGQFSDDFTVVVFDETGSQIV